MSRLCSRRPTMMPAMVALMVAVHAWAPSRLKVLSLIAVTFKSLLAGVTCSLHFVIPAVRLSVWIRWLMVASAILALGGGLSGVVANDMQLRNIGIVGYVGVFLVADVLLGVLFYRAAAHCTWLDGCRPAKR